jgi:predicted PurR-regulated permease PerM
VLAESIAVIVVSGAVLAPGLYLLRVAWKRRGNPRKFAIATLVAIFALIVWLYAPHTPGITSEERITQFIGAWGILFMGVGIVVIIGAALRRFRANEPDEPKK